MGFYRMYFPLLFPVEYQERIATDRMAGGECLVALPVTDLFEPMGDRPQVGDHFPDEYISVLATDVFVYLSFRTYDAFERAEAFQVRPSHVRDNPVIGLRDMDQFLDVARVAGAHLDNRHLVLVVQAE